MADTFEQFIGKERARLKGLRDVVHGKQKELVKELQSIEREMEAIVAYEVAKKGKSTRSGGRGTRRAEVLALVKSNPKGVGRADILEALGVKGDKAGEQSVSNALANLKKNKHVGYDEQGKKYLPAK